METWRLCTDFHKNSVFSFCTKEWITVMWCYVTRSWRHVSAGWGVSGYQKRFECSSTVSTVHTTHPLPLHYIQRQTKFVTTVSSHQQNVPVASGTDNTENSDHEATGQGAQYFLRSWWSPTYLRNSPHLRSRGFIAVFIIAHFGRQMNPVYTSPNHFFKFYFNIIIPSMYRYLNGLFSSYILLKKALHESKICGI